MVHAEKLMQRILFLEGTPNMTDIGPIKIGANVKAQLESDLELELDALPRLNAAIKTATELGDNASRELFEQILIDEEEHVDYLEGQLHAVAEVGIENYLAQWIHSGKEKRRTDAAVLPNFVGRSGTEHWAAMQAPVKNGRENAFLAGGLFERDGNVVRRLRLEDQAENRHSGVGHAKELRRILKRRGHHEVQRSLCLVTEEGVHLVRIFVVVHEYRGLRHAPGASTIIAGPVPSHQHRASLPFCPVELRSLGERAVVFSGPDSN